MPQRKRIGVITACLEGDYQQRVLSGIFSQANLYKYDVFVFSPLSHPSAQSKEHVKGEINIYSLINFSLLDGLIITPIPLQEEANNSIVDMLLERIKNECKVPVVSIDAPFGDFPLVRTDEKGPFVQITDHLIEVHGCKKIAVLNGPEEYDGSKIRLSGVIESMEKHGLSFDPALEYHGDFWYTSAEELGKKYLNKELPLPDAVICSSDYMAIGLTNTLIKGGIKVPDQVIVTGFDGAAEASLNNPPITSYQPHTYKTALEAVNLIHKSIEPNSKIIENKEPKDYFLCIGSTCGCPEDEAYTRSQIHKNQYMLQQNFNDRSIWNEVGIGTLFESYTNEILTGTSSTGECLQKIYESKYLIQPYEYLYLCLNQNWINSELDFEKGYSPIMKLCIFADRLKQFPGDENHVFYGKDHERPFPLSQMLPDFALKTKFKLPQVFYFIPIHFNTVSLGYGIVQNNLTEKYIPGLVFRNYIRMINNALEMTRTRNRIISLSEHDLMTNLLNRRGLTHALAIMNTRAKKGDKWLAIVADMDGLKYLNDNFGHSKGDEGLNFIAESMRAITASDEICVRNGGDEFLIAGLGHYSAKEIESRIKHFNIAVDAYNSKSKIPFTASIGFHLVDWGLPEAFDKAQEQADINMYLDKRKKKLRR